jgi:hypothetical protein
MKARVLIGLAVVAAALVPWTGTATATGDGEPSTGPIDIVYAEMDGSMEFNVWGTVRCTLAGELQLNLEFVQDSSGGVGAGASNSYTCPAPGTTVKWVMDASVAPPTSVIIDDEVTITVEAVVATNAVTTEDHVLHWGLPAGEDHDGGDG